MPPHPNQVAFTEGVTLTLASWTALNLAIQYDWSNDGLGEEKRDWMCEVLVNYFGQHGQRVEPEDIEDILLQIMQDEFNTQLEDGSALEISRALVKMYHEVIRGNHTSVHQLRERAQRRMHMAAEMQSVQQNNEESEEEEEEDEMEEGE